MNDDGTRLEICGREITGWKANLIVLAFFASLVWSSYDAGYQAGARHVFEAQP